MHLYIKRSSAPDLTIRIQYNMLVYPISLSFYLARSDIEMKNTIYYIPFNISMLNRTTGELDQIKKNALDMNITITK